MLELALHWLTFCMLSSSPVSLAILLILQPGHLSWIMLLHQSCQVICLARYTSGIPVVCSFNVSDVQLLRKLCNLQFSSWRSGKLMLRSLTDRMWLDVTGCDWCGLALTQATRPQRNFPRHCDNFCQSLLEKLIEKDAFNPVILRACDSQGKLLCWSKMLHAWIYHDISCIFLYISVAYVICVRFLIPVRA